MIFRTALKVQALLFVLRDLNRDRVLNNIYQWLRRSLISRSIQLDEDSFDNHPFGEANARRPQFRIPRDKEPRQKPSAKYSSNRPENQNPDRNEFFGVAKQP